MDYELWFVEFERKFDELMARSERRWAALEQRSERRWAALEQRGAADEPCIGGLEQTGVTLLVEADNWGGLFDEIPAPDTASSDSSSPPPEEQLTLDAHVMADNWGGLFEPAPVPEERVLDPTSTAIASSDSAHDTASTDSDAFPIDVVAIECTSTDAESAPTASSAASAAIGKKPEEFPHQIQELEEKPRNANIEPLEAELSNREARMRAPASPPRIYVSLFAPRPGAVFDSDLFGTAGGRISFRPNLHYSAAPKFRVVLSVFEASARKRDSLTPGVVVSAPRPPRLCRPWRAPPCPPWLYRPRSPRHRGLRFAPPCWHEHQRRRAPPRPPWLRPDPPTPSRSPWLLCSLPPATGRPSQSTKELLNCVDYFFVVAVFSAPNSYAYDTFWAASDSVTSVPSSASMTARQSVPISCVPVDTEGLGAISRVYIRLELADARLGALRAPVPAGGVCAIWEHSCFHLCRNDISGALPMAALARFASLVRSDVTDIELIGTDTAQLAAFDDHKALDILSDAPMEANIDAAATTVIPSKSSPTLPSRCSTPGGNHVACVPEVKSVHMYTAPSKFVIRWRGRRYSSPGKAHVISGTHHQAPWSRCARTVYSMIAHPELPTSLSATLVVHIDVVVATVGTSARMEGCAELVHTLRAASDSVAALAASCVDHSLRAAAGDHRVHGDPAVVIAFDTKGYRMLSDITISDAAAGAGRAQQPERHVVSAFVILSITPDVSAIVCAYLVYGRALKTVLPAAVLLLVPASLAMECNTFGLSFIWILFYNFDLAYNVVALDLASAHEVMVVCCIEYVAQEVDASLSTGTQKITAAA